MKDLLYKTLAGSKAYGTMRPESDTDIRGVYINTMEDLLGIERPRGMEMTGPGEDEKYYSLHKFMKLAIKCNPNIIELLWVKPEHIMVSQFAFTVNVYQNRHRLLSKKVADTFTGYAIGNLRKIEEKLNRLDVVDWKDAMHLIRLSRMGKEIIKSDGRHVIVNRRNDADHLLRIRNGEVGITKIMDEAKRSIEEIDRMVKKCNLPNEEQRELGDELTIKTIKQYHGVSW